MTQTITQAEAIVEMIKTLPLQQQEEVISFIEFLHFKAQKQEIQPPEEEQQKISAYEVAQEFAGCLEGGPSDLSTNKKYLQGNW
ncbi:hypothetical protein PCC9214_01383 [Planktothrix tepida]|uniref:Uncharacterized protein n=1 Tax=Planktothrix tepida PCC 9214 TaxID=671072 RepID=A0A1J1LGH9_9CYAN|nr:DUF2281 domain-containing protein [Planktothrix tepida]CAD5932560.1 hypothetical protein PCC9214_01383 [Planktothrix tepida]CUR31677.1 conserved hypothetical protein [Planktothrix tepida PCC 9214]